MNKLNDDMFVCIFSYLSYYDLDDIIPIFIKDIDKNIKFKRIIYNQRITHTVSDETGSHIFKIEGKIHNEDGPAVIYVDGSKFWLINDVGHRVDGPAEEWNCGFRRWLNHGIIHRIDGPAEYKSKSYERWFNNGLFHRDNDEPAIIVSNGLKYWYKNGVQYRYEEPTTQMLVIMGFFHMCRD